LTFIGKKEWYGKALRNVVVGLLALLDTALEQGYATVGRYKERKQDA
jgi:hypothetical protein